VWSTAAVERHIWGAFRTVNGFLQFYVTLFQKPQISAIYGP